MGKLRFLRENGEPCSERFNDEVTGLFEDHPVLFEMFRIDMGLTEYLIKELLEGNIKDWDNREEIASYIERHWNNPKYAERIEHAVKLLRQNAPMA